MPDIETVNPFSYHGSDLTELLADEVVGEFTNMLDHLITQRERAGLKEEQVAELIGTDPEIVRSVEQLEVSPTAEFLMSYALAVDAHISIRVTEGRAWLRRKLEAGSESERSAVNAWKHTPTRSSTWERSLVSAVLRDA